MGVYIDERKAEHRLKVRPYDRAAAFLIALLTILGAADASPPILLVQSPLGRMRGVRRPR